jgi:hypothetical protein
VLLGLTTSLLIYKNYYKIVEKVSMVMVVSFTLFTLIAVVTLAPTTMGFSWRDVASGLTFQLPKELIFVAIGAFGITGVASDEIIAYNYWCLEKGYAAYTGKNDGTDDWKRRAKGWIGVMQLDAVVAMLIYTLVTAAFYLLGASVLHGYNKIPEGNEVINTLSRIYTQSLGPGVRTSYLLGAFFVLYSSVFATLAYWTRLFMDISGQFGWVNPTNENLHKRGVAILAWVIPVLWMLAFLFMQLPTFMVMIGGVVGSVLLIVVVIAGIAFRKTNKVFQLESGILPELLFWLSVVSIGCVGLYGILKSF